MARPPRPRGSLPYEKPPLGVDQLVDRLAGRGLEIPDRDRATRYLRHIGYYRLSPYTIPFQQGGAEHQMRPGTSFDDVLDLYVFDRSLRLLVMDALERVEVAVRAALTDHMSTTDNDSHWYTNPAHFRHHGAHADFVRLVRKRLDPDSLTERSRKRLYPVLVSLQSVLESISPHSSWARRLHDLLDARPDMNLAGMGVPSNWWTDPFWSRHLLS